jgi:RNA polymerase sigma-70 factor (ECF subfamily)
VTRTSTGAVVTLGATEVAARAQFAARTARAERADVDGHPGVVSRDEDGTVVSILSFTVLEGRITRITALVDPAELARLDLPPRPPP